MMVATNLRYKKPGREDIPATAIKLSVGSIISLKRNASLDVTATLTPADSTDTVTWTTNNSYVTVTPKEGLAVVFKAGSTTNSTRITATTSSGRTAICTVTVET